MDVPAAASGGSRTSPLPASTFSTPSGGASHGRGAPHSVRRWSPEDGVTLITVTRADADETLNAVLREVAELVAAREAEEVRAFCAYSRHERAREWYRNAEAAASTARAIRDAVCRVAGIGMGGAA